jgi:hypothetical protein
MRPLSTWQVPSPIVGVFTDIDDTLTTEGAITPDALQALADLNAAGLHVVPITGRPVGWSEPFAASWPVDAIVAENGAVGLQHTTAHGLRKRYQQDTATRRANFARMQQVLMRIEQTVPGARRSQDSSGRETDIAIDHSEFHHLSAAQIEQVVELLRGHGLRVSVSSIHINAWLGAHDKWVGACWAVQQWLGQQLPAQLAQWVYIGDSSNDEVMFEHMQHSVGVANIARFLERLQHAPGYLCEQARGAGFAELANALLRARAAAV